MHIIKD